MLRGNMLVSFETLIQSEGVGHSFIDDDGVARSYTFPTLFLDSEICAAALRCSWQAARELVADAGVVPARIGGGGAVVVIVSYDHRAVNEMAPYREVAISIPVVAANAPNPPVLPLLLKGRISSFGYRVVSMPVTSRENMQRGIHIWGLPKWTADIRYEDPSGLHVCHVNDDGRHAFTLTVPTSGRRVALHEESRIYGLLQGRATRARMDVRGEFSVRRFPWNTLFGRDSGNVTLRLGTSPLGEMLRSLSVEPVPIELRHSRSARTALFLPGRVR